MTEDENKQENDEEVARVELPSDDVFRLSPSRPRGILTETDRVYLYGLKKYEHPQTDANRRQKIRERTQNSLIDFLPLLYKLDPEDRNLTFGGLSEAGRRFSIEAMIAFVWLGLHQNKQEFIERVKRGIIRGEKQNPGGSPGGRATDVSVSIEISYEPDLEKLRDQLSKGDTDQLTPAEIGLLVQNGLVDSEDIKKLENTENNQDHLSNMLKNLSDE